MFYKEVSDIFRLKIPFDNIYTSVFLIKSSEGPILIDCATTAEDVDEYIIPALRLMGYAPSDIRCLVLTHSHSDHAGGLPRLLELTPNIEIIRNAKEISKELSVYSLPGHTLDSVGVLDKRSNTLISGDGLQGAGVDKYRCSLQSKEEYYKTLCKIKDDNEIERILFSHEYEPWLSNKAVGRQDIENCLIQCKKYI